MAWQLGLSSMLYTLIKHALSTNDSARYIRTLLLIEYGEYITIHFPIAAQIKRNWGTDKYDQVQFIWINCHQIPFTIMKSPLKFASLSTLNPCLSVSSSNQALSGSTSLIPVAAKTSLKASFSKFLWVYGQLARIIS